MTRSAREQRARVAAAVAALHDGVAHRAELRARGISRHDVRTEVEAGRWFVAGRHTLAITSRTPYGNGVLWAAAWEAGSGAVLTGVSALLAHGLEGFSADVVHVALPRSSQAFPREGIAIHRPRNLDPTSGAGIPRVRPEWAAIRAAQWAVSDRQAALVMCLSVQQRLVAPGRLLSTWRTVERSPRREFLDLVIGDVCDGAHSLGELDLARECRRRGFPVPERQVVVQRADGRVYLDAEFAGGRVVEVDGVQHWSGLTRVSDALRANELVLSGRRVLRVPVLGLRLDPDAFMGQVGRFLGVPVMPTAGHRTRSA